MTATMPTKYPCEKCGQQTSRLELTKGWCPTCVAAALTAALKGARA